MSSNVPTPVDRLHDRDRLRVAVVGTYPPRRCGIATFTSDLVRAVRDDAGAARPGWVAVGPGPRPARVDVVALDRVDRAFPPEVRLRLRTDRPGDYVAVADRINHAAYDAVSLQHEYGIYGGDDGERVLDLLGELHVPVASTLHTVPAEPSDSQRRILRAIARSSARVVVLSHAAARLLPDLYGVDPAKVEVIPHGVPDLPFVDPDTVKPLVGLAGRPTILSFGLLGPGKGYELALRAMADVAPAVPGACYVILGATHPDLLDRDGEAYRSSLQVLAAELGLGDHVRFVDSYVDLPTLGRWLQASDVFVTPYPGAEQVVSGTLAYALGTGKALVSTPYAYAQELLADGRGRLVPFGDSAALGREIGRFLLDRPARDAARRLAYRHGRQMTWPVVGAAYRRLFCDVSSRPGLPVPGGLEARVRALGRRRASAIG
jgi:glycosyltransferase involved in cell wall biosynthesis